MPLRQRADSKKLSVSLRSLGPRYPTAEWHLVDITDPETKIFHGVCLCRSTEYAADRNDCGDVSQSFCAKFPER